MFANYTPAVLDHARNPRNVGSIDDANVVVQVGDPDCGDTLLLFMKIEDDCIANVSYLIKGCGAAIATASIGSELVKGKSLNQALLVTDQTVTDALGGLPDDKEHCSNLIASAVHAAISQYISTVTGEAAPISFEVDMAAADRQKTQGDAA
ncbi:iron-sulfur cluster assembly scaffold protein [Trichlorobacter sp.]|uniref:iron-sulfur cluster assembly scaffold protein n=1 Tax=Trichlorobacter sp. TaxID=2911007 RepID=UPI002A3598E2|nr:iron-sulfur cluster assembly scaffold protein [Trichlorobacter sp.]MDY0384119.1 iron-sulfur cluster assembly scaffold protein [Trichlorobacter sp.]